MATFSQLKKLLTAYSFEDLASSFFVLNLWKPNIASPLKSQYLYVLLEAIAHKLPSENQISSYSDFEDFVSTLLPLLPSFPVEEDYVPEDDWGDIRYFFDGELYYVFYGGDLSSPYDFLYSFEVQFLGFEKRFSANQGRSPRQELNFFLGVQNDIISGIDKTTQEKQDVTPGHICLPSEAFWTSATRFLQTFDFENTYAPHLMALYMLDLDESAGTQMPSMGDFVDRAASGKNCPYFFIKKNGVVFPALPRTHLATLFDAWAALYPDLKAPEPDIEPSDDIILGAELMKFVRVRSEDDSVFGFACALNPDLSPGDVMFGAAFISGDKLVLIKVLSPALKEDGLQQFAIDLKNTQQLLEEQPVRLGLRVEKKIVELRAAQQDGRELKPLFITAFPNTSTAQAFISKPKDMPGYIVGLEQLLGILDEIEDLSEVAAFFEYLDETQGAMEFSPFNSLMDQFAAFRDSNSVLVAGAVVPNFMMLDPHWGANFRYRSLKEFWDIFPQQNFFQHPRSWNIEESLSGGTGAVFSSKNFRGIAYFQNLGMATFFINSPMDALDYGGARIADLMMGSARDAIALYSDVLVALPLAAREVSIHVILFPKSLVQGNERFKHLQHLNPGASYWAVDGSRISFDKLGVRVVYDDAKLVEALQDANDRSLQIEFLLEIIRKANSVYGNADLSEIESALEPEKSKQNRFRVFTSEKDVSFPELAPCDLPGTTEYKIADKTVAQIAHSIGVAPGDYSTREAKTHVNNLKISLISEIDKQVSTFNFAKAIPMLIGNLEALSFQHQRKNAQISNSIDQDVDYEREAFMGEDKVHFLQHHKNFRYLIEKFVQLQPRGDRKFSKSDMTALLGLVDRLLSLYNVSDFLHHGIYDATVHIDSDFLTEMSYAVDIGKMQETWGKERAQIYLGSIGNKDDLVSPATDLEGYLAKIDKAWEKDLGFTAQDMIALLIALSQWANRANVPEATFYSANAEQIAEVCTRDITGFDSEKPVAILDFLTLSPDTLLHVVGAKEDASDLPIWEHRKRPTRYTLRPLIKIGEDYYWGPYSADQSAKIWTGMSSNHVMPADFGTPTIDGVLNSGHEAMRIALEEKICEVVRRFTENVEQEVYPHKLGISPDDIGDVDVFAYLEKQNIILNIESKIINQAFCNKDIKRLSEKIYGRRKTDGSLEKGYLKQVERRAVFLREKGVETLEAVWKKKATMPRVVSFFVTQSSYWWTKFPPVETDVNFVEVQLLEDFLQGLTEGAADSE